MASETQHQPELLVIGTNHRKSPVDFREKVAFLPEELPRFLREAHEKLERSDCFLLSTCNRTEFYTVSRNGVGSGFWELLARYKPVDPVRDLEKFYTYRGREAVEQLFRVACGLDSQMLGEPQILQQVKDAYEASLEQDVAGVVGQRLLAAAIRCGRRARAETEISHGAVSVAHAAVSLSHKVFADLASRTALVVGAGETGQTVARNLAEHHVGRLLVANRTLERARALATEVRAEPRGLDMLTDSLCESDIVISAVHTSEPIIDADMVRTAMKARQNRAFLIVDIGIPRNVHRDAGKVSNVFLHDVDSLHGMIEQNLLRRRREVAAVEKIIDEEIERFLEWHSGLQAGPVIKELRSSMEALRQHEIARLKGLTPEQQELVDRATRSLLNKVLHRPTTLLRGAAELGAAGLHRIQTIREVFGLDAEKPDEPSSQPDKDTTP